jgi:hypothetical protein
MRYAYGAKPKRFTSTRAVGGVPHPVETVIVEPQGSITVPLAVRPARARRGESQRYPIAVGAAVTGQSLDELTRETELDYRASALAGLGLLLLALLAAVLVLGWGGWMMLAGVIGQEGGDRPVPTIDTGIRPTLPPTRTPPGRPTQAPPPTVAPIRPPVIAALDPELLVVPALDANQFSTTSLVVNGSGLGAPGTIVELRRANGPVRTLRPVANESGPERLTVLVTGADVPVAGTYTVTVVAAGPDGGVRSNTVPLRVIRR